jgi:glycerol kinase
MLEAICFQTLDVMLAMQQDADCSQLRILFVDGGASQNNLLMQMQADILQVPVRRPTHLETTSLGAALAAGIGVGFWTVEEAFQDLKHNTGAQLRVLKAANDPQSRLRQADKFCSACICCCLLLPVEPLYAALN